MVKQRKRWRFPDFDSVTAFKISKELGIPQILGQLLYSRGYHNTKSAYEFFHAEETAFLNPFTMKGMHEAVERICKAIMDQENITVYGDYDVDGISSCVLTVSVLRRLGAVVDYYIPERESEGYGLHEEALLKLAAAGTRLLITVDCGISSSQEIMAIKQQMDVIVTDHHRPPEILPIACAILNPKQPDCLYAEKELAGVGVAFKLCQALWKTLRKEELNEFLGIVALGTIADVVSLQGENRSIVKRGLLELNQMQNLGLRALVEAAGLKGREIEAGTVGYFIAPRLNAAGRLSSAVKAVNLLLTKDEAEAKELAEFLESENTARKQIQSEILLKAEIFLETLDVKHEKVFVVHGDGWNAGVIGLVAARLVEKYYKPSIVISCQDGIGKASCRSIEGFNMHDALHSCQELLLRFGGHAAAAGFSILEENIPRLREALTAYAAKVLAEEDYIPVAVIDGELTKEELEIELVEQLKQLEPYGMGNKRPLFRCMDMPVQSIYRMGAQKQHLKIKVKGQNGLLDCVSWNCSEIGDEISSGEALDLVFQMDINEWNGNRSVQLKIDDLRTHEKILSKLDQLFLSQSKNDPYGGIGDAERFFTKLAGVTFENRQQAITKLTAGQKLILHREADNAYDVNAIAVKTEHEEMVGYIKAVIAKHLAPLIDRGMIYCAVVSEVTGGGELSFGTNLFIWREAPSSAYDTKQSTIELESVREVLIGKAEFHEKQKEVLEKLNKGKNILTIMGTGRGKSAIFQTQAVLLAINEQKMTIILYPLRALVNDQYLALSQKMQPLSVRVYKGCGNLSQPERVALFAAIQKNEVDILLSTPEFLAAHLDLFETKKDKIAFCVFDECHHFIDSGRPVYRKMDQVMKTLNWPLTLGVTATASCETAAAVTEKLRIAETVIDPTVRENLSIVDQRNIKSKYDYVNHLLDPEQKVLIFVNSRSKSVEIASRLREQNSSLQQKIGFYHAGLTNEWRIQVEDWFRSGAVKIVVATSAFGEGIDLPDIAHVVLYHLPFDLTSFNQQCGRCGRNGQPAQIHLLYGKEDVGLNEFILNEKAPQRELIGKIYLILKKEAVQSETVEWTNSEIAQACKDQYQQFIGESGIGICLKILEELRLIDRETFGNRRKISLNPPPSRKLDLNASATYQEGLAARDCFAEFGSFAMRSSASDLLNYINKPIYPID